MSSHSDPANTHCLCMSSRSQMRDLSQFAGVATACSLCVCQAVPISQTPSCMHWDRTALASGEFAAPYPIGWFLNEHSVFDMMTVWILSNFPSFILIYVFKTSDYLDFIWMCSFLITTFKCVWSSRSFIFKVRPNVKWCHCVTLLLGFQNIRSGSLLSAYRRRLHYISKGECVIRLGSIQILHFCLF